MTEKSSIFIFIVGLLVTAGGVGGVEQSVTDYELLSAVLVSVAGLSLTYAGVLGLRQSVDNKSN